MTSALVSIFCGAVLPIAVVLIIAISKMNGDNKRSQIIIKAIEANKDVDTDKLIESLKKQQKSAQEILNLRLLRGCIFSLIGTFLGIIGIVNLTSGAPLNSDPVEVPFVFGGISLALGISYLIVYFVTRKQIEPTEK